LSAPASCPALLGGNEEGQEQLIDVSSAKAGTPPGQGAAQIILISA